MSKRRTQSTGRKKRTRSTGRTRRTRNTGSTRSTVSKRSTQSTGRTKRTRRSTGSTEITHKTRFPNIIIVISYLFLATIEFISSTKSQNKCYCKARNEKGKYKNYSVKLKNYFYASEVGREKKTN